jgi:hypothetical protein
LLWLAAQVGRDTTGDFWAACGIVAGAGIIFALSQRRGSTGHPVRMFLIGFVPVLIVAGWVLLAAQPHSNWFQSHVLSWSGDMHIRGPVQDIGTWAGVLAFAIGFTLAAVLEPPRRRRAVVAEETGYPSRQPDTAAADEPVTAERREVSEPADEPAQVR